MKKNKKAATPIEGDIVEGMVERNQDTSEMSGAKRITLHVDKDGSIDWSKSKSGADTELLNVITNDPVMLEKIATCPDFQDDGVSVDGSVSTAEAGMILDVLTMVEGLAFSQVSQKVLGFKIDPDVVTENFTLTEEDHKRQDPLAVQGLTLLQEALQIDPRWRWALLLTVAHGASLIRNGKQCIVSQIEKEGKGLTPPNPATENNIKPPVN